MVMVYSKEILIPTELIPILELEENVLGTSNKSENKFESSVM